MGCEMSYMSLADNLSAGGAVEGGDYAFGTPTGSPILALAAKYILGERSISDCV
jgi:hypothetical protein